MTLVLFFSPHSLPYVSLNQVSYPGTKCFQCKIFSVFCWALARPGTTILAPTLTARAAVPAVRSNCRRVIQGDVGSPFVDQPQPVGDQMGGFLQGLHRGFHAGETRLAALGYSC